MLLWRCYTVKSLCRGETTPSAGLFRAQGTVGPHRVHPQEASAASHDPLGCVEAQTQVGRTNWCRHGDSQKHQAGEAMTEKRRAKRSVATAGGSTRGKDKLRHRNQSDLRSSNGPPETRAWAEVMMAVSRMATNFSYQPEGLPHIQKEAWLGFCIQFNSHNFR